MLSFVGIGWAKRLRKSKQEYFLSVARDIIVGNAIRKGEALFYFLVKYKNRNAIIVFLDGKGIDVKDEKQIDLKQFILSK